MKERKQKPPPDASKVNVPRGGGRHRKDLGAIAQAIVWYYAVRGALIAGLLNADGFTEPYLLTHDVPVELLNSLLDREINFGLGIEVKGTLDDKIDLALEKKFCVSERRFQTIRYLARDPGATTSHGQTQRLVDIVGAEPGFEHTIAIYDSLLWRLITWPRPTDKEITDIIDRLIMCKGLYRATDDEAAAARKRGDTSPLFAPADNKCFSAGINLIKSVSSADSMGLLGALFKEAISHNVIDRVVEIDDAFEWCLTSFQLDNLIDSDAGMLLHQLCQYRIFQDRWHTAPTAEWLDLARIQINQKRRAQNIRLLSKKMDHWRVQARALQIGNSSKAHLYPIVSIP